MKKMRAKVKMPRLRMLRGACLLAAATLFFALQAISAVEAVKFHKVGKRNVDGYRYEWNPSVNYEEWASENEIESGDVAVFLYPTKENSVWAVPSASDFGSCDLSNARQLCTEDMGRNRGCWVPVDERPLWVVSGSFDFCSRGQKVILQASRGKAKVLPLVKQPKSLRSLSLISSAAPPPPPTISYQQAAVQPLPGRRTLIVGGPSGGLTYPWNPLVDYAAWMRDPANKVYVGDVVVFQYPPNMGQVWRFFRQMDYNDCRYSRALPACLDIFGQGLNCSIRLTTDSLWLATGLFGRCKAGHKVVFNATYPVYTPKNIIVGYPTPGYSWPWNPQVNYTNWMLTTPVYVNDTIEFKYARDQDSVFIVPTEEDYNSCTYTNYIANCNESDGVSGCVTDALQLGTFYFVSGRFSHCSAGQKVKIVVQPQPIIRRR